MRRIKLDNYYIKFDLLHAFLNKCLAANQKFIRNLERILAVVDPEFTLVIKKESEWTFTSNNPAISDPENHCIYVKEAFYDLVVETPNRKSFHLINVYLSYIEDRNLYSEINNKLCCNDSR